MDKKGVESWLMWLLLAVLVLVIGGGAYIILSGKGSGAIEHIKNFLRFRFWDYILMLIK